MKFLYLKLYKYREDIPRLRFDVLSPSFLQKSLFSRTTIAKYLKINIKIIENIEKKYFRDFQNNKK